MQCQNTFGSYKCVCGEGLYWIDNKCQGKANVVKSAEQKLILVAMSVDKIRSHWHFMHTGLRDNCRSNGFCLFYQRSNIHLSLKIFDVLHNFGGVHNKKKS